MLGKLRKLFSRTEDDDDDGDRDRSQLDIEEIYDGLQQLITHNKIKLVENEGLIDSVEEASSEEEKTFKESDNDILKRLYLCRIKILHKRKSRLSRCSTVYNDNINIQIQMSDRLDEMRASGLTTITADILEEIALDYEEMYQKHRNMVNSVKAIALN
jgi:hypothetical protein